MFFSFEMLQLLYVSLFLGGLLMKVVGEVTN